MNILELDSYNLADAVKFHDRLNHRLWDRSEHLHPQVHAKLMEIARDFQEFLGVPDLDIKDITISGSNAAYNYTPNSDIDLHLVVDLPEADSSEVYRELFDAKKFQYNETHNITIGGYDVELYVQNPNQEHHSQGIYSLLRNAWVSVPRRRKADVDDISTRSKYEDLVARIDATIATGNYERLSELMKKIRAMRQSGLEQQGEFGADNLAFKMLRNNGYIKRLVDARNAARDLELSLAELAQPRQRVQYGFMSESPDGVNPSTKMFLDESDVDSVLPKFFDNCIDFLGIQNAPEMVLHNNTDWSESTGSFGQFDPDANVLHLATSGRHVLDILRTMAHELTHCRQNEKHPLPDNAGETGSRWEDQANAMAGRIMRHWAEEHPEMFKDVSLEESASGYIPRNKKEAQDPRYSMALSVDIKPGQVGREANKLALNTGRNGEPGLLMKSANLREGKIKLSTDPKNYGATIDNYKATGPVVDLRPGQLVGFEPDDKMNQPASKANVKKIIAGLKRGDELPPLLVRKYKKGYQILDGHHRFHAYKLTGAKSIPVQIVPAKDIEELKESRMPQPSQGQGRYRELNEPLGPESPPTMPAGTVRVDVSDVYDWYKLGQHISNMKGLGKHDFGAGPPSSIISFGDEETEHKFIKDLEATGLDVTDIDPKDPKQPQGMRRIKTDPTYNVAEQAMTETAEELEELTQFSKVIANSLSQSYTQYIQNPQSAEYVKQQIAQPITDGSTYKALMPVIGIGSVPGANTYTSPGLELAKKFVNIVVAYFPPPDKSDYYGQTAAAPAVYDPQSRTVAINKDFLSNPEELAGTIAHEVQHGMDDLKSRKGLSVKTDQQDIDLSYYDQGKAFKYTQSAGSADQGQKFKSYLGMPHEVNARFTEVINSLKQRIEKDDIRNIGSQGLSELARSAFNQHYMHEVFPNGAKDPGYKRLLSRVYAWLSKYYKDRLTSGEFKQPQAVELAEQALAESLRQELSLFEDDLFEIRMSPSSLRQEAARTGALAGMEFEMIVPNVEGGDDGDLEPDYEYDERCRSIDDAVQFFHDGDYNGRREVERLREKMQEDYFEWIDEKLSEEWDSDGEEYILEWVKNNVDEDEWNPDALEGDARNEALEEYAVNVHADPGSRYYQNAYEEFREERQDGWDESDWLDAEDLDLMSYVENRYSISWPHWTTVGGGEAEISDVAQDFENAIGRDTWASSSYHSGGTLRPSPTQIRYVVEPDGSLEGDNPGDQGLEFVSPPLPIDEILGDLNKVKAWAKEYGCYTNDSTGLHINISVPNYSRENLDFVKLALLMGDRYVLDAFGRTGNTYAKSALGIIKDAVRNKPEDAARLLDKMKGNLDQLATKAIHSGVTSKYTSINTKDGHIEFRSPGGDWLDENFDKIENTLMRFTVAMSAALNPEMYREEYLKKLYKLLTQDQKDSDTIKYFSEYVAGKIPRAALRSFVKQAQLERKVKRGETKGQKMWWSVERPGYFASVNVVASSKEEAIEKGKAEYPDWRNAQDMTATPLRPYEEPTSQTTQQGNGPSLNGRPSNPDGNYVILNMADETVPVYRFMAANDEDALLVQQQWSRANPGPAWRYKADPAQQLGQPSAPSQQNQGNWGVWIGASERFARLPGTGSAGPESIRRFPSREAGEQFLDTTRAENPRMRTDVEIREIPADYQMPGSRDALSQTDVENRLGWGGQAADANYEIVYRGSNPPQRRFAFIANTPDEAARKFDRWLATQGLPANTEDYGYREIRPEIPEVPLDIEQNLPDRTDGRNIDYSFRDLFGTTPQASSAPPSGEFTGEWRVLIDGEEVHRFGGIGNNQADANRIGRDWILQQIRSGQLSPVTGAEVAVVPVMTERMTEGISPDTIHKLADRKGIKWDNEPSFLKLTKRLTGKAHLDDLDQAGLEKVKQYLDKQGVAENFADGRNPQDKGDSKRYGVPTKASVSTLRKVAKQGGRKGQLAHWMANMKAGRAKAKKK